MINKIDIDGLFKSDLSIAEALARVAEKQNEIIQLIWQNSLDMEPGDVELDFNGHDFQCNIETNGTCDCFRNPEVRKVADEALAKLKKNKKVKDLKWGDKMRDAFNKNLDKDWIEGKGFVPKKK